MQLSLLVMQKLQLPHFLTTPTEVWIPSTPKNLSAVLKEVKYTLRNGIQAIKEK